MNKKRYYSLGALSLLLIFAFSPAFGEVTDLQIDSESFYNANQIKFSGSVEKNSVGLVTIVIRDHNNEFVELTQAKINHNDSFEKIIKISDSFSERGGYSATGFILNMTKGVTTNFEVSPNGLLIIPEDLVVKNYEETDKVDFAEDIPIRKTTDFVDPNKNPQHYIDRYYNEASYRSWFDRNYPELTIEEAVNHDNKINSTVQELIDKEIIPTAEASSIVQDIQKQSNNSEIAEILLAIAGLGILFGAVIGIKKKVDNNSKQISINRDVIRKIIQPIIGTRPKEILQTRLVKGEITVEEYEKLKSRLD
ncbi:MAG: SHOCT domain-containing protein [Nitrosopumilus sp.]|nr:SHOCT domain-containing protein [Nitrosopumilus sp.]